jgi:DNA (cytosine-5)-methyltransferase 1
VRFGSLFAGIGGFDLGFERAGIATAWQVEQDPYCRSILERHFPDAERFEDVREVGGAELRPVDGITAGFPCQPVSVAGRGLAQADDRWLWPEVARIVGDLRPRYVVLENVAALLGRGMGDVLGDLSALGYDAEWAVVPAAAVGAPHLRNRVWIVAYPGGEGRREVAGGPHGDEGPDERRTAADDHQIGGAGSSGPVADADGRRRGSGLGDLQARQPDAAGSGERSAPDPDEERRIWWSRVFGPGWWRELEDCGWWTPEPGVRRVDDGLPAGLDFPSPTGGDKHGRGKRLMALGNALVPQIAQWIGERIVTFEANQQDDIRVEAV